MTKDLLKRLLLGSPLHATRPIFSIIIAFIRWCIGLFFITSGVSGRPITTILAIIFGLLIFPPTSFFIEKIAKLNKPIRITAAIIIFMAFIIVVGIEKSESDIEYEKLQKINAQKLEQVKIQNKLAQDKKIKEARILTLKFINIRKKELKTTLDKIVQDYDLSEYNYSFYILPITWMSSSYKEKEAFLNICAEYGSLSFGGKEKGELALAKTKIKNYSNGEVLGEYSIWSGFKFK